MFLQEANGQNPPEFITETVIGRIIKAGGQGLLKQDLFQNQQMQHRLFAQAFHVIRRIVHSPLQA